MPNDVEAAWLCSLSDLHAVVKSATVTDHARTVN